MTLHLTNNDYLRTTNRWTGAAIASFSTCSVERRLREFAPPGQLRRSTAFNVMRKLRYEPIPRMSRDEIESAIARDDSEQLVYGVLSAALYDEDAHWAENVCVRLANHPNVNVRGNAIEGLGHIARTHRTLNLRVRPLIERALRDEDSWVRGKAHDAADDVTHFLKWDFAVQSDPCN